MATTLPAIARTKEDVLNCVQEGFCLVVEADQAFLVEGLFRSIGLDRKNIPVLRDAAAAAVKSLRKMTEQEIAVTCRPLHKLSVRRRDVYGEQE